MGFGNCWKVMEINNAICQDLDRLRKGRLFKMTMEKFWNLVWKTSKIP